MVVKEILELICIREFIKTMPDIRNGGLIKDSKAYVYDARGTKVNSHISILFHNLQFKKMLITVLYLRILHSHKPM